MPQKHFHYMLVKCSANMVAIDVVIKFDVDVCTASCQHWQQQNPTESLLHADRHTQPSV